MLGRCAIRPGDAVADDIESSLSELGDRLLQRGELETEPLPDGIRVLRQPGGPARSGISRDWGRSTATAAKPA